MLSVVENTPMVSAGDARLRLKGGLGAWLAGSIILVFLALFLLAPVGAVFYTAFVTDEGQITLGHFSNFFGQYLFRESFLNSLTVALLSVLISSLIAIPLAYLSMCFEFRGALIVKVLGVLPLIMPPFVGAVALQLIFGRNGSVNLLLAQWLGVTLPVMEGLGGVIFVESLHYFPFILLSLLVSLRNIDVAMAEAAHSLGCTGFRLFRRLILPMVLPGFLTGASLVFVKVFDDLGTPLVLGVSNMLATQAFARVTSIGVDDPLGYVISVIMIVFSMLAMWLASRYTLHRDYGALRMGSTGIFKRKLTGWQSALGYVWVGMVLLLVLSPHLGILLMSVAKVWSYSVLPEAYTPQNYVTVFSESSQMILNTLLYCGVAAALDVVVGTAIAYLMLRTQWPARLWLHKLSSFGLAIPGLVLAIGYLRVFKGLQLPFSDTPVVGMWVLIMLAYTVRRLPFALQSCYAALQQVHASMEESAQALGSNRLRTVRRIVLPLMAGGVLVGFVTSFITAAVELSATIMLTTTESDAPMSYGIYLYMQSTSGRGTCAALGVIAVLVVMAGTYLSHWVARRGNASASMT